MADAPSAGTASATDKSPLTFETHPSRYRHWKLTVGEGGNPAVARLAMAVDNTAPLKPGYDLKLNSYDLAVDIELADAIQRLRFEHPAVKVVVVTSDRDRIFCAGANIFMLASSTHAFKVNFCKFTNETRLAMEDASAHSGQKFLAACNGPTAGGGYELALACDEILLIDDGSSTVSLPEVPLLGVLPGTGGLTRLVDKRKVRRDLADVFSTTAEGFKGKRAVEWRLVDAVIPRSKWAEQVKARAERLAAAVAHDAASQQTATSSDAALQKSARAQDAAMHQQGAEATGVPLPALAPEVKADLVKYRYVTLAIDRAHRTAELTVQAPVEPEPDTAEGLLVRGADCWALRAFRELDDALLRLRFHHEDVGVVLLKTRGDHARVLAADAAIARHRGHWFVREIALHMARVLRRLDQTARSFFAVIDPGSCFAGSLFELALAADRSYLLDDASRPVQVAVGALSDGSLPMAHGPSRLKVRFAAEPAKAEAALASAGELLDPEAANAAGLVTVVADEIDFDDELRVAIEERVSMSPDALTGMEASLRCVGAESFQSKIFGRLSAWQNWIFIRPNATGPHGALSLYGKPERPSFDWRRT